MTSTEAMSPSAVSRKTRWWPPLPAIALLAILVAVIFGPLVWNISPVAQSASRFAAFSGSHPLGTDMYGRDLLARILTGGRWSLGGATAVCAGVSLVGFIVGSVAALGPRLLDAVLSRLIESLLALPTLVVALALSAVLGFAFNNLIVALIAAQWPWQARIFRMLILRELGSPYIDAAITLGVSRPVIVLRHIVPNIIGPGIVVATASLGSNILSLASLSFLGLGMQAPTPEWGIMIGESRLFFQTHPLQMIVPGIAIALTVLNANAFGDMLRDSADPNHNVPRR